MKFKYLRKVMGKAVFIIFSLLQTAEAMMDFIPTDRLVASSEYIVVVKVQSVNSTGEILKWRGVTAKVVQNQLQVIESIKGSLLPKKFFTLDTLKFNGWMEDNVELPSKGLKVLLFLKRDNKGELKPVNGIQGVWYMKDGEFTRIGHSTTLKKIREMVQKHQDVCSSRVFIEFLDTAEIQTQAGHYKEALEAYRKAYDICPMRDFEEQMAWLMGEVSVEDREVIKSW